MVIKVNYQIPGREKERSGVESLYLLCCCCCCRRRRRVVVAVVVVVVVVVVVRCEFILLA